MITFGFTMEVEGILAEVDTEYAMNKITKQIHQEIGETLHGTFLPRHFQPSAAGRYGYTPRSQHTREIRRRQVEQGKAISAGQDLVKTGKTRTRATGLGIVRAYPRRGEVTFYVPHYVLKRQKSGSINLRRELETISVSESKQVRDLAETRLLELIRAHKKRRRLK